MESSLEAPLTTRTLANAHDHKSGHHCVEFELHVAALSKTPSSIIDIHKTTQHTIHCSHPHPESCPQYSRLVHCSCSLQCENVL